VLLGNKTSEENVLAIPSTQWSIPAHDATQYGSRLLIKIIPQRRFPFPKSLYAVEDVLRFFIHNHRSAIVLDFFSGSGTTAHAVMRLNKQDGGRRQCISVTNNEVAADEQATLRKSGLRPSDADWEKWGICDYITKPRIAAAITGKTPEGKIIEGDYKFNDEFSMAKGFEENAEFFTLTYETPVAVSHNRAFERIAPLLWMRAGSKGRRIQKVPTRGWEVADCPRAEVMVSFRAATDKTHITQLLGRMVRTPLARRIPGNDRLNSVDCLLPRFDKKSVLEVVNALMSGGESGEDLPIRRILINPCEMKPNPAIPEEVWTKLLSLPSQTLPKRQSRPVKRLTALAHELAADELLPDAGKKAHAALHRVLDGAQTQYEQEIKKARQSVLEVEGKSVRTDMQTNAMTFDDFLEIADYVVIEDAYKRAGRIISPDLATTYSEHLAAQADGDEEEALIEAHTVVAALGLVPPIKDHLDSEAEKLANEWLTKHKSAIKKLTDERQEVYRQIREMSAHPMDVDLARPNTWMQPTTAREANGNEFDLPRFERHFLCDSDGLFPEAFNSWEGAVVLAELEREGVIAWYRNPDRASQDSLGVTYEDGDEMKIVRPDFIFFSKQADGNIIADIVDPHGIHLADALPKLKGLAKYTEANVGIYRRVDAIAKVGETFRVLNLAEQSVREAIGAAVSVKSLYESKIATYYSVA
jgi:hypothetical protein